MVILYINITLRRRALIMGNAIYRATVTKDNSFWDCSTQIYRINYKDKSGDNKSYRTYREAAIATQLINKYFNSKNPTISFQQAQEMKHEVSTKFPPKKGGKFSSTDWYTLLRDAIDDFTGKGSDGGENITPQEVYKIYERIEGGAPHK